jgi:DNA-binding HxlR family transcriptional regulator
METSTSRSTEKPRFRAGGQALMLLAAPLNVRILRCLEQGPLRPQDLRVELDLPPQSTMRLYLRVLGEFGAIVRQQPGEFPASPEYEITQAGRALLEVGETVRAWLEDAPSGPRELGSTGARSTLKALVEGWSNHIIRILAARPLSLTEMNSLIPRISYPSLERRLTAMRDCDLIEVHSGSGRLRPYTVTDWLRQAIAPILAAIAWERTYAAAETAKIGRLDVETGFLLTIPLMDLPRKVNGKCRLAVEVHDGTSPIFAGVLVGVEQGAVTSCVASLEGEAEAWATGSPVAWLQKLDLASDGDLELGGDRALVEALLEAFRRTATAHK